MPLLLALLFMLMPVLTEAKPQKLDATYKGEELLLVESEAFDYEDDEYFKIHGDDLSKPLYQIYWNPENNQYYYAKAGSLLAKTNGLTYKLDPAKTNATLVYHPKALYGRVIGEEYISYTNKTEIQKLFARNLQPGLAFAGWVSSNQRLFIHIKTKQQYLQTLNPIDDNHPYYVLHLIPCLIAESNDLHITYGSDEQFSFGFSNRSSDGNIVYPDDGD